MNASHPQNGLPPYLEQFNLQGERGAAALEQTKNVLCLAGPGAGKTHLLVAHAVQQLHTRPGRVVMLTFSRGAATEMLRRVNTSLADPMLSTRVVARTLHAHAFEILQTHGRAAGYPGNLQPIAERGLRSMIREALERASVTGQAEKAQTWLERFRRLGATAPPLKEATKRFVDTLESQMRAEGLIDYGGAVVHATSLLRSRREVADSVQRHDQCILLDEAQDCDPAQLELLDACLASDTHLFVAMDPDQSLYGWRQADPERSLAWAREHCAHEVQLTENFRCAPRIHDLARSVLRGDAARTPAEEGGAEIVRVENFANEGELVAQDILRHGSARTAVLAYARWRLEQIEVALRRTGIPFSTQTSQWSDAEHQLLRALTLVDAHASQLPGEATPEGDGFDEAATVKLKQLATTRRSPLQLVHETATILGTEESEFKSLLVLAGGSRSLATLLKSASNGPEERASAVTGVSVSTFHGAKGQEFDTVFIVGVEAGRVPRSGALTAPEIEEARRALYVAITRAEKRVVLTHVGAPSPFLSAWLSNDGH